MSIFNSYQHILSQLPKHVQLVAVSKTKPVELISELYSYGQLVFGENRVQELIEKHQILPKDIRWHMIGHLQSKKVKQIAPFISLIHSVDSIKLLDVINKEAEKNKRKIECLLQFHIANEESKYGFLPSEIDQIMIEIKKLNFQHTLIKGVMGMATFTDDENQIRKEFSVLKTAFDIIKEKFLPHISIISMGMSGDYSIAIDEGSNMVRVGSSIFGTR